MLNQEILINPEFYHPCFFFNFQEFAQIYGNDNRNDKNNDIKKCKYSLRIQDYFERFNCLPISFRNPISK